MARVAREARVARVAKVVRRVPKMQVLQDPTGPKLTFVLVLLSKYGNIQIPINCGVKKLTLVRISPDKLLQVCVLFIQRWSKWKEENVWW